MKYILLSTLALILAAPPIAAQTATTATSIDNYGAVGASWNRGASPAFAGTALYAKSLATDTYWFTALDSLPSKTKPYTVSNQVSIGTAKREFSIGKIAFFWTASAGGSWTGTNSGWAATAGGMAVIPAGNLRIMPTVRFVKSNVSASGWQPIFGLLFGKRM